MVISAGFGDREPGAHRGFAELEGDERGRLQRGIRSPERWREAASRTRTGASAPSGDPLTGVAHANGLLVLGFSGGQVSAITRFDTSVLPGFGLPPALPA